MPTADSRQPTADSTSGARSGKTFFYTLDGIRGVAALLIVMRHTEMLFTPWNLQESYLAVDVFFVLSGVVIAQAYGSRLRSGLSFPAFAWIRVVRIMPLYLLGSLISLLAAMAGLITFGPWHLLAIYAVLALFMIPNPGIGTVNVYPLDNPAWSLPLELVVNLFYARCIRTLSHRMMLAIMLGCSAGMALTLYKAQSHSLNFGFWARSFPFGLLRVGYSFFAGVLIFNRYTRDGGRAGGWQTAAAWGIIAAVGLVLAAAPGGSIQPYYDFVAVTLVFPALVYLALLVQPAGASARLCRLLGAISYAVYTLHAPLSGLVEGGYAAATHRSIGQYAPYAGIAFAVLLVPVCSWTDRHYDFPLRRFLLSRLTPRLA